MDIRNWCSSGCKTMCLSQDYHEVEPVNSPSPSSSTTAGTSNKLKLLWVKFKKEKMKIFESPIRVPCYDPHTYSQNFDHGFTWDEPENLSRSFSVRFADPSSVFLRKTVVPVSCLMKIPESIC